MKRFAAICFLCLLLFNTAGYRLLFDVAEQQARAALIATVEQEQYDASELITITVPLSLPYQTDWADWEKVRGEIEIDGVTYQYVQRKVSGGQIMLQCLPNKQQAKIESARDRFFELANSFQADNNGKNGAAGNVAKFSKPVLTDFDDQCMLWRIPQLPRLLVAQHAVDKSILPQPALTVIGQPPEVRS